MSATAAQLRAAAPPARRPVAAIGGLVLGIAFVTFVAALPWSHEHTRYEARPFVALVEALFIVAAVAAASRRVQAGAGAFAAYATAVVVAAFASSFVTWITHWTLYGRTWHPSDIPYAFRISEVWWGTVGRATWMAIGVVVWLSWRRARETRRALQQVELAAETSRRQVHAVRLATLQAHIEPDLLFSALSSVAELQKSEPRRADDLLADLIALLRALVPGGPAAASTVAEQVDLVAAYWRVIGADPGDLRIRLEPAVAEAALGPMLLLPLVRALRRADIGGAALELSAEAVDAPAPRLRVLVAVLPDRVGVAPDRAQGAPQSTRIDADLLETLRDRLRQLHGGDAVLRHAAGPPATIDLEMELDDAHRPDR